MFLSPMVDQMMASRGLVNVGLHDQNILDVLRQRELFKRQQDVISQTLSVEQQNYRRLLGGFANLAGIPVGPEQQRFIESAAGLMSGPMGQAMAMMAPDFMDILGGRRGSPTVMAQRMLQGGRYQLDPVTGMMGLSADSTARMTKQVWDEFYGPGANLSEMRGISAGQMGQLYDELSRRGRIAAPMDQRTAALAAAKATGRDVSGLSGAELDQLQQIPEIADRMRDFDAGRVKQSLRSYISVVSALRDIFGDRGRPDAPMGELLQMLDLLTQNGVSQINPGRLNTMVREAQSLAKITGVPLEAQVAMQQHAAQRLEQMGASPLHAPGVKQDSVAWGAAARAMGSDAVASWGRFDPNQMQQLDLNLRANAMASDFTNRMGLIMRLRDQVGGFKEGSPIEAAAQAAMSGNLNFTDPATGRQRSLLMGRSSFDELLLGAQNKKGASLGLSHVDVGEMLLQQNTNDEYRNRYPGIGRVGRLAQNEEILSMGIAPAWGQAISQRLEQGMHMPAQRAQRIADSVRDTVARRIRDEISVEDFADNQTRQNQISQILQQELGKQGVRGNENFFRTTAELGYGRVNADIPLTGMRHLGSYQNIHTLGNQGYGDKGAEVQREASTQALIRDRLSGQGPGTSGMRSLVESVMSAKPTDDLGDVLGRAMGVPARVFQQGDTTAPPLQAMQKAVADVIDMGRRGASQADLERAIELKILPTQREVTTMLADKGVDLTATGLDPKTVRQFNTETMDVSKGLERARGDKKLLKGKEGEALRNDVKSWLGKAESLSHQALVSPDAAHRLGTQGLGHAKATQEAVGNLQMLASKYAGGDVTALLAGQFKGKLSEEQTKAIKKQVEGYQQTIEAGADYMSDAYGGTGPRWATNKPEQKQMADALAAQVGGSAADHLKDIEAAATVKPGDVQAFRKWTEGKKALGETAGKLGLKDEAAAREWAKNGRALSHAEVRQVERAQKEYDKWDAKLVEAKAKGNATPSQIAHWTKLRDGTLADPQLLKAMKSVGGHSPQEMMQQARKGELHSEETQKKMRHQIAEMDAARGQIKGMDDASLEGAGRFYSNMDKYQEKMAVKPDTAEGALDKLFKSAGVEDKNLAKEFAAGMGPNAVSRANTLASGTAALQKKAAALYKDDKDAQQGINAVKMLWQNMQTAKDPSDYRRKKGFSDEDELYMSELNDMGLFGGGGRETTMRQRAEKMRGGAAPPQTKPGPAAGDSAGGAGRGGAMTIAGTLKLDMVRMTGDINARGDGAAAAAVLA